MFSGQRKPLHVPLQVLLPFGVVLLLVAQLLYISQRFDAYTLVMANAAEGWRGVFGYLGQVAKIAVLWVVLLCVLLKRELPAISQRILQNADARRVGVYLLPQLISYWLLVQSSGMVFAASGSAVQTDGFTYLLWCLALAASLLCWAQMLAPVDVWHRAVTRHWKPAMAAALVAAAVWVFTRWVSLLWEPLSRLTLTLSSSLLALLSPEPVVMAQGEKVLGLGDFVVRVAPVCSGYEGIGLVAAFLALYLYVNRAEFRFPRALVLFPLGIATIWLLNTVRIAVLVAIGFYWSADVALGGFHSQAGWISFILTSLGLLWVAGRWQFVRRAASSVPVSRAADFRESAAEGNHGQAIATLIPMIVLLASVLLTSAISEEFVWLYPLRVIAVVIALLWVWPVLKLIPFRPDPIAFAAGAGVAWIWILLPVESAPGADELFTSALESVPLLWSVVWLLFRFVGAVITVPLAEELAFRGYLLCKCSRSVNYVHGRVPVSAMAILTSSLSFGLLHGAWIAGILAGLAFAFVRLRSPHIGSAIVAHGIANLLVFLFAACTGQWSLI